MRARDYQPGERVRVTGSDAGPGHGTVCEILRVDSEDDTLFLDWHGGWWVAVSDVAPVSAAPCKPAVAAVSGPTGEGMGLAHAKAWRLFTAKTPRDWLLASGWSNGDAAAVWVHEDGHSFEYGVAEQEPDDESPLGWTAGLDARTLRSIADLLDEHNGVTP
jgi:hypothetical protein